MTMGKPIADETDKLSIDPFAVIDHIRNNPNIPSDSLAEITNLHEIFVHLGNVYAEDEPLAEALWLAYHYGTIIGAYVSTQDPGLVIKINGLLQTQRAKLPRPREWHLLAEPLAINIRRQFPELSQEKLAVKIDELLPTSVTRPSIEAIVDFISEKENAGVLPRAQKKPHF